MKKAIIFLITIGVVISLTACGNTQKEPQSAAPSMVASTATPQQTTAAQADTQAPQTEISQTEQPREEQSVSLQMTIGNTPVAVDWEDNDAVQALKDLCLNQPLTIDMSMYGGFEQVGSIGTNLPSSDAQTTTSAGDIVLYSGNQMVVFYGSNTWAYTRLGHITDKSQAELTQLLSNGDITVTINLA